jgi:hypothetical protein
MIPVGATCAFVAATNMGLQLAGFFGYRPAGSSVGTSLAILRQTIAHATPIM